MKENKVNANGMKYSSADASMENVTNLPEVEVADNTTTKGKVTGKFTAVDDAIATEAIENIPKNEVDLAAFYKLEDAEYFCPIKFDSSLLESSLSPLVESGIMSEDVKTATINKAKAEFLAGHSEEIEAANKLSFAEVLQKLQENESLYKKLLRVCKVSEFKEGNYIFNDKVAIYRASQCLDKEGNNRYTECTLTAKENGVIFSSPLFMGF